MGEVVKMVPANDDADPVNDWLVRVEIAFVEQSGMTADVLTRAMLAKACNGLIEDLGADEAARFFEALAMRISPPMATRS